MIRKYLGVAALVTAALMILSGGALSQVTPPAGVERLVAPPDYVRVDLPDPQDESVLAFQREFPDRAAGAREALQRQAAGEDLIGFGAESFPSTYAGASFDYAGDGALVLYFKGDVTSQREHLAKHYPWSEHLRVESVDHALSELEEVRERIVEEFYELQSAGWPVNGNSIDVVRNRNVIFVEPGSDPEIATALRERYGPEFVEVEPGRREAVPATCHSRYHCVEPGPVRGGLRISWIQSTNPGSWCTYGYSGFNSAGARYAITAGHCAIPGEGWFQRNTRLGGVPGTGSVSPYPVGPGSRFYSGSPQNYDGARVYIGPSTWNTSYYIWADDAAQLWQLQAVQARANIALNTIVCKSGATTEQSCGAVSRIMFNNGIGLTDAFETTACANGGDSGSPIYTRYNSAGPANFRGYGILSARVGSCTAGDSQGAYLSRTPAQLDISVHTTNSQP